jgi:hypothetical protein
MKKILPFIFFLSMSAFAEEAFLIPSSKFQIKSSRVEEKLEMSLKYPEKLLKRFQPLGAKITNKSVSGNSIRFHATKTVAFISKTVAVSGVLDTQEDNSGCAVNEKGYTIILNLDGSDAIVSENIDRLEAKLCTKTSNSSLLNANVKGKIVKGAMYSNLVGGVAKDIIAAQVEPLIKALTEEIQSMN